MQARRALTILGATDLPDVAVRRNPRRAQCQDPKAFAAGLLASCTEAAARLDLDAERVLYCAAAALFGRCAALNAGTVPAGQLAESLGLYAVLAGAILEAEFGSDMDAEPATMAEMARRVDERLTPAEDWPRIQLAESASAEPPSRMAARCALPFAMGAGHMVSDEDLEFLAKAVCSGNTKAARYALNYVLQEYEDALNYADEDEDEDDEEAGAAAGAAAEPKEPEGPEGGEPAGGRRLHPQTRMTAGLSAEAAAYAFERLADPRVQHWARASCKSRTDTFVEAVTAALPALPPP
jgi:hypothetical protein